MAKLVKINLTYHAPEGDSKVVEMMNMTFFDGQAVDMIGTAANFATLENNPHFQINSHEDYDPGDNPPATGSIPGPVPVKPPTPAHPVGGPPTKSDADKPAAKK